MFEVPADERPRLKKQRQHYFIGRWLGSLLILAGLLVPILGLTGILIILVLAPSLGVYFWRRRMTAIH